MKKILLSLILCIILVGTINAWEFDNIRTYDSINNEITFKNSFLGLPLDEIAKAKLDTPQVNYVIAGKDRLVAQMTIDSYTDYSDFIKGMELIDLKTGGNINREITYKYAVYTDNYVNVPDTYKEICEILKINDTNKEGGEYCYNTIDTWKKVNQPKVTWIPLEKLDIKIEKLTIGIFTDVFYNDNVEWYPTLFGVKVIEWATWTSSMNIELKAYYPLDEGTGTIAYNNVSNLYNFTTTNAWTTGLIDGANKPTSSTKKTNISTLNWNSLSFSVYYNRTSAWTNNQAFLSLPFDYGTPSSNGEFIIAGMDCAADKISMRVRDSTGVITGASSCIKLIADSTYHQLVFTINSSQATISNETTTKTLALTNFQFKDAQIGIAGALEASAYYLVDTSLDEIAIWNRTLTSQEISDLWNNGIGISYNLLDLPSLTASQSFPINNYNTLNNIMNLGCNFSSTNQNITSIKVNVTNSTGIQVYSNINDTLPAGTTSINYTWITSTLGIDTYNWSCNGYGNQGYNVTSGNRTFSLVSFLENTRSFNHTTYQTSNESFMISLNGTISSVSLIYNGTSYATTNVSNNWTYNLLIPSTVSGNTSFYWNITSDTGNSLSTTSYQYRYPIDFKLCNLSTNVTYGYGYYLNVTFIDEVTLLGINGTLNPFNINYYLDNSGTYKTYTITNTTLLNPLYQFCFNPISRGIQTSISASSSMTNYPLRTFSTYLNLSNTTTVQPIYLISSSDGVYQPIIVKDGNGIAIPGATVTATNALVGTADTKTTDANGQVTLWLNPNSAHTIVTTKTGYPSDSRIINPTTTTVYITLGSATGFNANESITFTEGVNYTINPQDEYLYNQTAYNFQFILYPGTNTIDSFRFDLYNSTDGLVVNESALTNGGTLSNNYNVGNDSEILMIASWTSNGTTNTITKRWTIMNSADTQYSINYFINRLRTYIASGMFGLTTGFGLNLFCFIIILIVTGVLSYQYGLNSPIMIAAIATMLTAILELGLGLMSTGTSIPFTFWIGLVLVAIIIKEGFT